jgi:hypothetical protein
VEQFVVSSAGVDRKRFGTWRRLLVALVVIPGLLLASVSAGSSASAVSPPAEATAPPASLPAPPAMPERVARTVLDPGGDRIGVSFAGSTHNFFVTRTSPASVLKTTRPGMTVVDSLVFDVGENFAYSAITDGVHGYFSVANIETRRARIIKVRLSDMTRVGSLTLGTEDGFLSAATTDGTFGYFSGESGLVIKVRLADMTRVGSLQLNDGFLAAAINDGTHAYFAGSSIVRVRLADMVRVDAITTSDEIVEAVTDGVHGYFGGQSKILKVQLSSMAVVTDVDLPGSSLGFTTAAAIDPAGGHVFFVVFDYQRNTQVVLKVRRTDMAIIQKGPLDPGEQNASYYETLLFADSYLYTAVSPFDYLGPPRVTQLLAGDLSEINQITVLLDTGESYPDVLVSDSTHLYVVTSTRPAQVVKLRLSDLTRVNKLVVPQQFSGIGAAVIVGSFGYFATYAGVVLKVNLDDLTIAASQQFIEPGSFVGWTSMVLDADRTHAYLADGDGTGITKVRLDTLSKVGEVPLDESVRVATTDGTHGYFATAQSSIVKVRFADMTSVTTLEVEGREFLSATTDGTNGYFGANDGVVRKVRLADMTITGELLLTRRERVEHAWMDADGLHGYFLTERGPSRITKIRLADMTRVGATTLRPEDNDVLGVASNGTFAYLGVTGEPAAVATFRLAPVGLACGFDDASSIATWAIEGACWLRERAITVNNPYKPGDTVTRAQMAGFLWRYAGSPTRNPTCGFTDQAAIPSWAREGACWLKEKGITTNAAYDPGGVVTRAQMAAFMYRLSRSPSVEPCIFQDSSRIPSWATDGSCWLKQVGVTTADPYNPLDPVTRMQMAAFLHRLFVATKSSFSFEGGRD